MYVTCLSAIDTLVQILLCRSMENPVCRNLPEIPSYLSKGSSVSKDAFVFRTGVRR